MPVRPPIFVGPGQQVWPDERTRKRELARRLKPVANKYWDADWRKLRRVLLQRYPFCACGAPATECDHIIDVRIDRSRRLDPANVITRCKSCHSRRTMAEVNRRRG